MCHRWGCDGDGARGKAPSPDAARRPLPRGEVTGVLLHLSLWGEVGLRGNPRRGGAFAAKLRASPMPDAVLSMNLCHPARRLEMALPRRVEGCLRHGVTAISPWRDQVEAIGLREAARIVTANGLRVTGLCRGGMFPAASPEGRLKALDDNRRAIDETGDARCRLPGAGGRQGCPAAPATSAKRAKWWRTASRWAVLPHALACAPCRWPSSRCIRCMPPTGPA